MVQIPTDRATVARFHSHTEPVGNCLFWCASLNRGGYGQFNAGATPDGKKIIVLAHRYAHLIATGEWPRCVCHQCDQRRCVDPSHLFGGTHLDNNRDMFAKGRGHVLDGTHILGEANHLAKLSVEDVLLIRQLSFDGVTCTQLGRRFGVDRSSIYSIVKRKTWQHVRPHNVPAEEQRAAKYGSPAVPAYPEPGLQNLLHEESQFRVARQTVFSAANFGKARK